MLQLKNISVYHKKDCRALIENFSLVLNNGDKAALIGEEGNGKSTLLKIIYDPGLTDGYAQWDGEIVSGNLKIGYLPQEMPDNIKKMTCCEYFLGNENFNGCDYGEFVKMAADFGLSAEIFYLDTKLGDLSGGEKIKIQLMYMMMDKPDVLLLDEPTNDIDVETLEKLEVFIKQSRQIVLYISHDETLLENTANVIIHFEQIRKKTVPRYTIARCGYAEYTDRRLKSIERQEQNARKERDEYDKKMEKYRQIRDKVDHQLNSITRQDPHGGFLLKKKMKSVIAVGKRFEREKENMTQFPDYEDDINIRFDENAAVPYGKNVITIDIPELFAGGTRLSERIKLNVTGGEKVCITGRNGVGKTTLMKIIAEQLLQRTDIKAGYMPQNYEDGFKTAPEITPPEFLAGGGGKNKYTRARTYLGSMKYTADEMSHPVSELSGGQKAKLYLMKLNFEGCSVLLLDEPTRNLSPLSCRAVREAISNYNGAVIAISHDRKFISEVFSVVYELTEKGMFLKDMKAETN